MLFNRTDLSEACNCYLWLMKAELLVDRVFSLEPSHLKAGFRFQSRMVCYRLP